jgi:hypothetical protein
MAESGFPFRKACRNRRADARAALMDVKKLPHHVEAAFGIRSYFSIHD